MCICALSSRVACESSNHRSRTLTVTPEVRAEPRSNDANPYGQWMSEETCIAFFRYGVSRWQVTSEARKVKKVTPEEGKKRKKHRF
jgi:hypothetical protein